MAGVSVGWQSADLTTRLSFPPTPVLCETSRTCVCTTACVRIASSARRARLEIAAFQCIVRDIYCSLQSPIAVFHAVEVKVAAEG